MPTTLFWTPTDLHMMNFFSNDGPATFQGFYIILVQFSLYVRKGGLKPHSFHFINTDFSSKRH